MCIIIICYLRCKIHLLFQNDYLDSFDTSANRQTGTDIKEGKITWVSVTAYKMCNSAQKEYFLEHYGKHSQKSVEKIMELYKELHIPQIFLHSEEKLHSELLTEIKQLPDEVIPHELLLMLLKTLRQHQFPVLFN